MALASTAEPTFTDARSSTLPDSAIDACAPSDARSRTSSEPWAVDSTAFTVSCAPAVSTITGAATDTATGSIDIALSRDASFGPASACCGVAAPIAAARLSAASVRRKAVVRAGSGRFERRDVMDRSVVWGCNGGDTRPNRTQGQ